MILLIELSEDINFNSANLLFLYKITKTKNLRQINIKNWITFIILQQRGLINQSHSKEYNLCIIYAHNLSFCSFCRLDRFFLIPCFSKSPISLLYCEQVKRPNVKCVQNIRRLVELDYWFHTVKKWSERGSGTKY